MRTYIFSTESTENPHSGGLILTAMVWRLKHNHPVFLGTVSKDTAGVYGEESEVQRFLIKKKLESKKHGNYYFHDNGRFRIYKV